MAKALTKSTKALLSVLAAPFRHVPTEWGDPMTKRKANAKPGTVLEVKQREGERPGQAVARNLNDPFARHGITALQFQGLIGKGLPEDQQPGMIDYAADLQDRGRAAAGGDLKLASHILASQAVTLDAIFTEMARRSGLNMGEYLDASERYMRLALKAQANSRATLEALAKLHQPREQTVRHVHVNEGGQAVIADNFHNHTGGSKNGKTDGQPHATGTAGQGKALLSLDASGNGVPIASREGQPAMQDARRQRQRRT